jgi:TRAP-type C4-dicarboxylate transport system permease large subunit
MCTIAYPEMNSRKYDPKLSLGCLAAGGTLGILIPPSVTMIIYAMFAEESVGQLFMAGFIPGIILALAYIGLIYGMCRFKPSLGPQGQQQGIHPEMVDHL